MYLQSLSHHIWNAIFSAAAVVLEKAHHLPRQLSDTRYGSFCIDTIIAIDLVVLTISIVLLLQKRADRLALVHFIQSAFPLPRTDEQRVLHLARKIFLLPLKADPVSYSTVFAAFGARPSAVIHLGGCCAGKARLLILSLAELGIRAYQIALYHRRGQAQHCLVEVCLGRQRLIVDPMYGIFYTAGDGNPISLADLQSGLMPLHSPLLSNHQCGYPKNSYYDFCYTASKTANWTKSVVRRFTYRVLHAVTHGSIDRLIVPAWLEWPQHLIIISAVIVIGGLNIAGWLLLS